MQRFFANFGRLHCSIFVKRHFMLSANLHIPPPMPVRVENVALKKFDQTPQTYLQQAANLIKERDAVGSSEAIWNACDLQLEWFLQSHGIDVDDEYMQEIVVEHIACNYFRDEADLSGHWDRATLFRHNIHEKMWDVDDVAIRFHSGEDFCNNLASVYGSFNKYKLFDALTKEQQDKLIIRRGDIWKTKKEWDEEDKKMMMN